MIVEATREMVKSWVLGAMFVAALLSEVERDGEGLPRSGIPLNQIDFQ